MGSPLSPIIADMVTETLLNVVIKQLNFTTPLLLKYVDDLILAVPQSETESTLKQFNLYNHHLQFTMEIEKDGKIPYLDTLITRNMDQTLQSEWYLKPISSGRLINYHSFHPMATKINVAYNFISRVDSLTTNQSTGQIKQIAFKYLLQNNYPKSLINRMLNMLQNKKNAKYLPNNIPSTTTDTPENINAYLPTNQLAQVNSISTAESPSNTLPLSSNENTNLPEIKYISLPYIPQLSQAISKYLKREYDNIKISFRTIKTLHSILPAVKDKLDKTQHSKVVYSISCDQCDMHYIGMTRNKLCTRLAGHKSDMNKYVNQQNETRNATNEMNDTPQKTALMDHVANNNHTFDLTHTTILDRTQRSAALPILEMLHISVSTRAVNHRRDVEGLSATYGGIIHTIKKHNEMKQQKRQLPP